MFRKFRKFFTSITIPKLFLLLTMGVLLGVTGSYTYSYIQQKLLDSKNMKKDGPRVTWTNEAGEKLTGFEGKIVELEDDILKIEQEEKQESIKMRADVLITLKVGAAKMEVVGKDKIRVGDRVALMAIEKENDLWTTGYVKILR